MYNYNVFKAIITYVNTDLNLKVTYITYVNYVGFISFMYLIIRHFNGQCKVLR